jgi:hypothetical protein
MTFDDDQPKWQVIYQWSLSRRRFRITGLGRRDASRGPRCSNVSHLPPTALPDRRAAGSSITSNRLTHSKRNSRCCALPRKSGRRGPPRPSVGPWSAKRCRSKLGDHVMLPRNPGVSAIQHESHEAIARSRDVDDQQTWQKGGTTSFCAICWSDAHG